MFSNDVFDNSLNRKYAPIITVLAVCLFICLAFWSATTTAPESDEGSFASPAANLIESGHFGTTVFELEGSTLTRINERTYWVMPLFLLNVAAFFEAFGVSLVAMRSVSIIWGVVSLISWYFIVFKISGNRIYGAITAALISCNYVILSTSTLGRGDAMCAALGFAALAVYLWGRERNLLLAIFLSQALVVASGLTHFLGIMAFLGLLFLTVFYDRRSIGWRHIAVAMIPYFIGGIAFGLWVLQDPVAFKDQFFTNAVMSGRMEGFSSPLDVILREFTYRYPRAFGLLGSSAGHSGPIYLKSLMLVGFVIGVLGVLLNRELRTKYRTLLILTLIYFLTLAILDGQKLSFYLIYIVPFYLALLGIWTLAMWEKYPRTKLFLAAGLSGLMLLGVGGIALRSRQNVYGKFFKPTIEYLNQNVAENELIFGAPQWRFGLKSSINHVSDGSFGYRTGRRAEYIIFDPNTEDAWRNSKVSQPELYEYLPKLLREEYNVAYENDAYKVYRRR